MKNWMNWKYVPVGLLVLSVGLAVYGLWSFFVPCDAYMSCVAPADAVHLLLIGMAGIAFVAWLKR